MQEREQVRYQEERQLEEQRAQRFKKEEQESGISSVHHLCFVSKLFFKVVCLAFSCSVGSPSCLAVWHTAIQSARAPAISSWQPKFIKAWHLLLAGACAAHVGARMKQYEDELARKRLMSDHELQRQDGNVSTAPERGSADMGQGCAHRIPVLDVGL
eukprot:1155359-Pelagomonas_calceolata.AAC.6